MKKIVLLCFLLVVIPCSFVFAKEITIPKDKNQMTFKLGDSPFSIHLYCPQNIVIQNRSISIITIMPQFCDGYLISKDGRSFQISGNGASLWYNNAWSLYKKNSDPALTINKATTGYETPIYINGYVYDDKTNLEIDHSFNVTIIPIFDFSKKQIISIVSGIINGGYDSMRIPIKSFEFTLIVEPVFKNNVELDNVSTTEIEKANAIMRNELIPVIKNMQMSMSNY